MGPLISVLALLLATTVSARSEGLPEKSYPAIIERVFGGTTGTRTPGSLRIVEGLTTATVNGSERLFVGSSFEWGLSIFTLDGGLIANWGIAANDGTGTNINMADVAVAGDGSIYASDYYHHRILVFSQSGQLLRSFGRPGTGPGELSYPIGLKLSGGKLYVVEHGNNRVQTFSLDGKPLGMFGSEGHGPGQFDGAYDIAINSKQDVFVTDRENKRVQKFDTAGNFVSAWGGQGITNDARSAPFKYFHEIAVDAKDRLYVTDLQSDAIRVFDPDGRYLATLWMHSPKGITIASDQSIFVGTWYRHNVVKLRPLDEHINNFPTCNTAKCPDPGLGR